MPLSPAYRLVAATAAVSLALASAGYAAETTSTKPNVIMIFTDDMGYGDISSFGNALKVKTPNIDKMAAEGTKFTQFYVAAPICSPSRASVLSGMFAPRTQITNYLHTREGNRKSDQNDYLDPKLAHLPRTFQEADYATAHVGKWHLGGGRDVTDAPAGTKYGYDEFYGTYESPTRDPKLGTNYAPWDRKNRDPEQVERHKRTEYMVDRSIDFLKRHKDQPCFITLWPDDVHTPYWPSDELLKKYNGNPGGFEEKENFLAVLEEYDRQIGRLFEQLKAIGADENTIVFFTGDNGPAPTYKDQLRTAGLRGMKATLYEGGIRQPFIIRWPGKIPAGKENSETVLCSVDLVPTLTKLAGVPMAPPVAAAADGEDMSGAVLGTDARRKKDLLWEHGKTDYVPRGRKDSNSPRLGIRRGDLKLLVNVDNTSAELYNVRKDPKEQENLAGNVEHAELVKELSAKVIAWSKSMPGRTHK